MNSGDHAAIIAVISTPAVRWLAGRKAMRLPNSKHHDAALSK
jgi:hypothetical protein